MLHRLKLKMSQSQDEGRIKSILPDDIAISLPSSPQPPSSNSSISSTWGNQMPHISASLSKEVMRSNLTMPACDVFAALTKNFQNEKENNFPCANVTVTSTKTTGEKRKAQSQGCLVSHISDPSDSVPSIVNVVSSQHQRHIAKKPRTVSISNPPASTKNCSLILAGPGDSLYLNPLHCFVRRNIEYFVATERDALAPCPGRKNAVSPGQVGLRCIHCRGVNNRNRTKRAVCYPSSVHRIYHCVSDMKFDHFSNCNFLPAHERKMFDELKDSCSSKKRGKKVGLKSCNTARYYLESAKKLGLTEGPQKGTVILRAPVNNRPLHSVAPEAFYKKLPQETNQSVAMSSSASVVSQQSESRDMSQVALNQTKTIAQCSPPFANFCQPVVTLPGRNMTNDVTFKTRILAAPSEEYVLPPVHCFVRKNVEVFAATPEDVAAPAPGRKTRVTVGQIGIRCIHCARLPPKERVKRAACYPPTILSIYHSISNMKFDHFGACRGLSKELKQEFATLRESRNKKSGKKINRKTTAQYYIDSAIQDLKLIDTPTGIRPRGSTVHVPESLTVMARTNTNTHTVPLDLSTINNMNLSFFIPQNQFNDNQLLQQNATNGMSVLMMAATDPGMREAYEKRKSMEEVNALNTQPATLAFQ